ncbi:hypothetical protein SLS58_007103 [Diplodia intermedia]|uniref:Fungal N-terminal domain-containing protein n=1 Tax=Diplodia intermedia TaxID=856260 RepID=A0ABR3TL89_9PEZI
MSGIEVAGLVLGAIPLAVKAFKIYAESVSQVKRYRGYRNHLQDLYQDLDSEYIVYLNTCEQLLDGIVDHNAQKTKLLEDPGGDAWRDPELEEKLKRRLARSYENYMETVQGMKSAVEEIKARLKLGPDGKVQLKNANKFREEIHRIKFSIQKPDYEGLIARITRNNLRLSKLTEQNRSLEESRYPKKRKLPDFSKVQSNARHVYKILSAGLQCGQASSCYRLANKHTISQLSGF